MGRGNGSLWVAIAFAAAAIAVALWEPFIDDQGHMSYMFYTGLRLDFWPNLFFQKPHPPLGLLYLPVAGLGWPVYAAAHAAVGALSVYFVGRAAAGLGGIGWLASLALAVSPTFVKSVVTGQSNSDGVFFLALGLFLYVGRGTWREAAAGVVLGASAWTRFEVIPILAVLFVHALVRRRHAAALGFLVFPLAYLAGGAVYHGDLLWWWRLPPALVVPDPLYFELSQGDPRMHPLPALASITPLWLLPAAVRWRDLPDLARWALCGLAVNLALVALLPVTSLGNADYGARTLSLLIALLAPGAALCLAFPSPRAARILAGAGLVTGAVLAATTSLPRAEALFAAAPLAVVALGWLGSRSARAALAAAVAAAALGVTLLQPRGLFAESVPSPDLRSVARWLGEEQAGRRVYTNSNQLARLIERDRPGAEVFFLPGYDILEELHVMLNRHNGQYTRVLRSLEGNLYGRAAWPCSFRDHPPPADSLFVLVPDFRFSLPSRSEPVIDVVFPDGFWSERTVTVRQLAAFEVRALRPGGPPFELSLDGKGMIDREALEGPCR